MHLHQWADVLVLHRAFVLVEPPEVEAVQARLVLQITLAALVANGTVERVVGEDLLHDVPPHDV